MLVEIRRSIPNCDLVVGTILDSTSDFVLIQRLDDSVFYDGYALFRKKDISEIRDVSGEGFQTRALDLMDSFPVYPDGLDVSSLEALVRTFARIFPLVTVHVEQRNPNVCFIGRIVELNNNDLILRLINENARFKKKLKKFELSKITRFEWGGLYEKALDIAAEYTGGNPEEEGLD